MLDREATRRSQNADTDGDASGSGLPAERCLWPRPRLA